MNVSLLHLVVPGLLQFIVELDVVHPSVALSGLGSSPHLNAGLRIRYSLRCCISALQAWFHSACCTRRFGALANSCPLFRTLSFAA